MDDDGLRRARELGVGEARIRRRSDELVDRSVGLAVTGRLEGLDLADVQRVLRPGAPLLVYAASRKARPLLSHYFEVEDGEPLVARTRPLETVAGHFNAIAPEYANDIPPHLRQHYLERKLAILRRLVPASVRQGRGLELGCGLGWYANALAADNHPLVGLDPSRVPLSIARRDARATNPPDFVAGDSVHLPFRDASFDYAYAINVLHHLKRGEQERALREIRRVLRPGAPLVVFEINISNPLFAWYMRRVFPRTRRIDRGDEEFIHPDRWPLVGGLALERMEFFTFAPDFVPRWALRLSRGVERLLERAIPRQAIHYAALLHAGESMG